MRFEIPFDSAVFTAKSKFRFKLIFGKVLRMAIILFSFGGVVVLAEVLWLGSDLFGLSAGIALLYIGVSNFLLFNRYRRRLNYEIVSSSYRRNNPPDTKIYEFEEEYFRFRDVFYDYSYKWSAFKYYRVIEKNLLFYLREGVGDDFIMIGEAELGSEGTKAVTGFVATKLRKLG